MNTKKKWTKSISVTLLVVLASLVTTGLVLADHYPPVGGVAVNSLTSFEQYQAAIDHLERDRTAALTTSFTSSDRPSQNSFVPYLDEFDQTELDREFTAITSLTSVDTRSQDNFLPYLDEFDQTGPVTSRANDTDDSRLRWEQYFKYAR